MLLITKQPSECECVYEGVCVCVVAACAAGTFGVNCEERCSCMSNSTCDAVTGQCQCSAGWTGDQCQHGQSRVLLSSIHCTRGGTM